MSKIGVKFVQGGKVYSVDFAEDCNVGDKIVVETIRGLEVGEVCKETDGVVGEEIKKAIRLATEEDIKKAEELSKNENKVAKKGENIETEIEVSIEEAFYGANKKVSLRTVEGKMKTAWLMSQAVF